MMKDGVSQVSDKAYYAVFSLALKEKTTFYRQPMEDMICYSMLFY